MGVTVKRLEYFDHSMAAKGHPVYAMIVSHEIEEDQSDLNDDGLSPEERRIAEEEKEAERTKRQVEADLGGYDIDDNETEDVFDIDKSYGLAPPISKERHEVLLVDANGWKVLDRFLLNDYEQGLSLKTMALTEVRPKYVKELALIGISHTVLFHVYSQRLRKMKVKTTGRNCHLLL